MQLPVEYLIKAKPKISETTQFMVLKVLSKAFKMIARCQKRAILCSLDLDIVKEGDIETFLAYVRASGGFLRFSFDILQ